MDNRYADLNKLIERYKRQRNTTTKDFLWDKIVRNLYHHIWSLMFILTGQNPGNISPRVLKIVLSNFQSASSIKDTSELMHTAREIIVHAGLSPEDVHQEILKNILELIEIYKDNGMSFLQVLSWLLPRRMANWTWRLARDSASQFYVLKEKDYPDIDVKENYESDFLANLITHDYATIPHLTGLKEIEVVKLVSGQPEDYVRLKKLIWKACQQVHRYLRHQKQRDMTIMGLW